MVENACDFNEFQEMFETLKDELLQDMREERGDFFVSPARENGFSSQIMGDCGSCVIEDLVSYYERCMNHAVPGGKATRGLSVVKTVVALVPKENFTPELLKQAPHLPGHDDTKPFCSWFLAQARVVGWCVEWLQAFFLVVDDVMDESLVRRGIPCW